MTDFINSSLQSGVVPYSMKSAAVTPLLKKPSLDINKNYRPVSNLPFPFKGFWASCGIPVKGIHGLQRPPRPVTIGLQDCSQHWVGTTQCAEWHSSNSSPGWSWRYWYFWDLSTAFDTIDHIYPARPHVASARNEWCCACMVWVIPHWAHSEDLNRWCLVTGQVPPFTMSPRARVPGSTTLPHLHSHNSIT